MARKAQDQAKDTFGQAKNLQGTSATNAQGIFNPLLKSYQDEVNNPQGIGQVGLDAENTASQQSTGGAISGAVGQNNLMAARTRNKGGFQIANDEAARTGMRTNSQTAVNNIAQNERLKETQRQMGRAGEHSLFDTSNQTALAALNPENASTQALTSAGQSGWFQNMLGFGNMLSNLGKSASGFPALGCWIAAELFGGWDDPRTELVRTWLWSDFNKTRIGAALVALYMRFGERVAAMIRKNKPMRAFFSALFNQALRKAQAWRDNAGS
jgi:hypothetical protein